MSYAEYLKVEDWELLDERVFHFFNESETPFRAVCVKIGTFVNYKATITGTKTERVDIVRWISRGEYERLLKGSGTVIF